MKRKLELLLVLLTCVTIGMAFIQIDPKKEIFYNAIDDIETEDYKISFADMHSQATFTLMKVTIENKSEKYLVFDLSKINFHYRVADKDVTRKEKIKIIKPESTGRVTIKVINKEGFMQEDNIDVTIDGIMSYDPEEGQVISVENFKIPAEKKKFDAGDVTFSLKDLKPSTDETIVKFKVENTGDDMVLLDGSKVVFEKENGDISINMLNSKITTLLHDDKTSLKLKAEMPRDKKTNFDMQFSTFYVNFKDALTKVSGQKLGSHTLLLTTGEGTSEE